MNTTSVIEQDEYEDAEPFTPREQEALDWGKRSVNNDLAHLQDSLKQMVTLLTTLLAGSAALYAQLPGHALAKGLAAALLMGSMVASLLGWLPIRVEFRANVLDEVMATRQRLIDRKATCLRWCCVGLVLAFATLLGGAILAP